MTVAGEQRRTRGRKVRRAIGEVARPFAHTGRYLSSSWRDYRNSGADSDALDVPDLPIARPTIALAAQAFRDEVVLAGLKVRRPVSRPAAFRRINDEVVEALEFYRTRGWLEEPKGYFVEPPALTDVQVKDGRDCQRLSFDSGYAPHPGEPGAERWLGYTALRREYAVLLRHPEPRPWLICVHGTEMGRPGIDLRIFRARKLHEELGLNVVLPVLPMHGRRARGLPKGAVFPGEDVMDDVHATAQAVWDIRRLLTWVRAQEPESPIGLNSMSLGGYIAVLVASLDSGLTSAILGVPVANLVELLSRHSGLRAGDPRRDTMKLAEPIGEMMSPLSLTPLVPMRGRFVYAGVADQVVNPREQVIRLWEHWGKPEIYWYRGGHAGFIRSRPVQVFIQDALQQSGLLDGYPPLTQRPAS
ncbi:alpha/beta hydrolase family protein [Mycobacterium kiyosense]|uniref:Alpha/beta hydrolase n=1 Tax=Mycobacterium kiyosense TaxID=2871094 RepID=A0AA37V749_9MYCO|nr:hypothetical protein [Mycobacterium kiyosense]GLB85399.1 alpha/beta hydrolase [Mycobacterium kiyosense]GLB98857.1 alpha/beta hydrolase [Mycobacterium kiyosense]